MKKTISVGEAKLRRARNVPNRKGGGWKVVTPYGRGFPAKLHTRIKVRGARVVILEYDKLR